MADAVEYHQGGCEGRMTSERLVFGIEELDRELGGGLIPGMLTVLAGGTRSDH